MKLCATVCTYNRPHLLPRVIASFEAQNYEDRCMLIYDDGGQYDNQSGDGGRWFLVSEKTRQCSLGAKRNISIKFALDYFPNLDAILPCDDDDMFLPWHFTSAAKALENADWSRPSVILSPVVIGDSWIFIQNYTGTRADQTIRRLYHPAWAMKIGFVLAAGGYPNDQNTGEDQALMRKLEHFGAKQADPIELGFRPSYIYCWGNDNISGMITRGDPSGLAAWKNLKKPLKHAELSKWSFPFNPNNPVMSPCVYQRPF